MVKEELVEGLKVALRKGESLRSAMMTFYNAGYLKEEIEEAAAIVNIPKISSPLTSQSTEQKPFNKTISTETSAQQVIRTVAPVQPPFSVKVKQKAPEQSYQQITPVRVKPQPALKTPSQEVTSVATETSEEASTESNLISYRPQKKIKVRPLQQRPRAVIQRVSEYEEGPNKLGTAITIILVSLLLVLLGILAVIFLFKDEILILLNKFFEV